MRTAGWVYRFDPVPWATIEDRFTEFGRAHPEFAHMAAIVESVRLSDGEDRLAGLTSMHDLIVVPQPIQDPPFDVVAVRSPSSLSRPPDGQVRIEHLSVTGRNDRIERPVADAVPLFWRFMIEKFGVQAVRSADSP